MSESADDLEAMLRRILGESRAASRQVLRHRAAAAQAWAGPEETALAMAATEDMALGDRIARIWDCLDPERADPASSQAPGRAARLRLMVALASLPGGERRRLPRWPMARPANLRLAARQTPVTLLDLGGGGTMLAPVDGLPAFAKLDAVLVLAEGSELAARLQTDADRVAHITFLATGRGPGTALAAELLDWAAHYEMAIWQVTALANEVEQLIETALSAGEIVPDDLFGAYRRGSANPHRGLMQRIATVLTQALPASPDLVYVVAADRDGHVACDPMDRLGDDPITDAVGLRAARFAKTAIVQTYRRLPGREPDGVVADIAAPVVVRGRRWGCVRIGRDLPQTPQL